MKKIGLILTPIEFGGAERVSLNLLRAIDRKQFNIIPILLIRPWEGKTVFESEIEQLGYSHIDIPVAKRPADHGNDIFRVYRCFRMLISILVNENIDLIHTNGYFADIIGIPIARLLRIPIIATCHGYIQADRKLGFYNKADMFLLRYANMIICVSDSVKGALLKANVPNNKMITLQNAVHVPLASEKYESESKEYAQLKNSFGLQHGDMVIGYTGRLSVEKGLITLIQATEIILQENMHLSLKVLIVGDGPDRTALEKEVYQKSLESTVIFAGFQDNIPFFLNLMDIFILSSLTEGTPMALLEAMAYGLPTIATSVGGIPAIIKSGFNGVLIPPSNAHELAVAILQVISDKAFREQIGTNARETIRQNYNLDHWIKKTQNIYLLISA